MTEQTMAERAGVAFVRSEALFHYELGRTSSKPAFFEGFIAGIKDYANHLYNKGSIFDIANSVAQTADMEKWGPLFEFEKTVLRVIRGYEVMQRQADENRNEIHRLQNELRKAESRVRSLEAEIERAKTEKTKPNNR